MPTISFSKPRPSLEVPLGANLMKALIEANIPVASSCLGDGICGKCRIIVLEGTTSLSPESQQEHFLREKFHISGNMRISCQTQVLGDITIDTTYW
jgi:2Fe-2S ferredoxin